MSAASNNPRPRALADIGYNHIINADVATSSEDESPAVRDIGAKDVQSMVGVSLGRAQTHFTSQQTPAAEKEAAIDEQCGFFGGPLIEDDAELDDDSDRSNKATTPPIDRHARPETRAVDGHQPTVRLPSPWRAGPKKFKRTDESKSVLKDSFIPAGSSLEAWRDALMSSMPSLPKNFSFASPFSSDSDRKARVVNRPRRSGSLFASFNPSNAVPTRSHRKNHSVAGTDFRPPPTASSREAASQTSSIRPTTPRELPGTPLAQSEISTPLAQSETSTLLAPSESSLRPVSRANSGLSLRRSASESSLHTFRTLSRVPSLGDDSRFENVQEQVNSRMKALRDSWQDTNIRLPLLPSLPSFSDLSMARTNSFSRKNNLTSPKRNTHSGTQTPVYPRVITQTVQPAKAPAHGGFAAKTAQTHPHFSKALAELTGDVVVLGGYRGSILRSAEPPHRQLWAPIKVGLNVRKVDLEVGLEPEDDERAQEKVIPGGMLSHIGPVDISKRLFKRLRASEHARSGELRVHDYGYDWRLEPGFLSKQLIKFLEKLPCNRPGTPKEKRGAMVVAHSLGGLVTRNAVNQRPDLFAGVVYAGVPMTCVNILGPFRNGDDVLLSSRVLTAQVNFTIRTSFALLPLDGRCFFNKETKEEYPVDFFDPQHWIDYRWSPCIARPLPSLAEPPQPTGLAGIMNSMASVLPGRKSSISTRTRQAAQHPIEHAIGGLANPPEMGGSAGNTSSEKAEASGNIDVNGTDNMNFQMDGSALNKPMGEAGNEPGTSIATTVTIPREAALAYLTRTLASVKKFKQELNFRPEHADTNSYPPVSVIYGKATPTVYGAKVVSREAIKHADAYDNLAFASGDGVVLAKAAMLPEGYQVARGGLVSSERGHVTLLGDLEAVGRCLRAVMAARKKGVGMGSDE